MGTISNMIERIQRLNIKEVAVISLQENTKNMADMNRQQLMEGVGSDGEPLNPSYAWESYARQKNQMNSLPGLGNPDLKLTGKTHDSITYTVEGEMIKSKLNDVYGLEAKYTTALSSPFRLSKDFKALLIRHWLRKSFKEKANEKL